jgi:hypothetical protein
LQDQCCYIKAGTTDFDFNRNTEIDDSIIHYTTRIFIMLKAARRRQFYFARRRQLDIARKLQLEIARRR